jgi:hypothetical protein
LARSGPAEPKQVENREGFAAHDTTARQFGDDAMVHQILGIVDNRRHDWILHRKSNGETERILDPERVRRAELRVKTRGWLLAPSLPASIWHVPSETRIRRTGTSLRRPYSFRHRAVKIVHTASDRWWHPAHKPPDESVTVGRRQSR